MVKGKDALVFEIWNTSMIIFLTGSNVHIPFSGGLTLTLLAPKASVIEVRRLGLGALSVGEEGEAA